jgi:hypothetical protein
VGVAGLGFGGVVERPAVAAGADWYIHSYYQLVNALKRYKVRAEVLGFGCLTARIGFAVSWNSLLWVSLSASNSH